MNATKAYVIEERAVVRDIAWVCRALHTDESRFALMHLRVEEECIVATDGWRLHKQDIELGIPIGCYSVIIDYELVFEDAEDPDVKPEKIPHKVTLVLKDRVTYPKWRQAIPDHGKHVRIPKQKRLVALICMKTGILCDCDYLMDAIDCDDTYSYFDVGFGEPNSPIILVYGQKVAVVIPLRQDI